MSAEPQTNDTQPPFGPSWQNFGTEDGQVVRNTAFIGDSNARAEAHAIEEAAAISNGGFTNKPNGNRSHKNNNYVNFNEFIMQHNFASGNGSSNGGSSAELSNRDSSKSNGPFILSKNSDTQWWNPSVYNAGVSNEVFGVGGAKPSYTYPTDSDCRNNPLSNIFNTNPNTFACTSGPSALVPNTSNLFHYEQFYTPFNSSSPSIFGSSSPRGISFGTSNLQASAPEFVPSFKNLSLNEAPETNGNLATSTDLDSKEKSSNRAFCSIDNIGERNLHEIQKPCETAHETNSGRNLTKKSSDSLKSADSTTASSSSSSPVASTSSGLSRRTGALHRVTGKPLSSSVGGASHQKFLSNADRNEKTNSARTSERERERDSRRFHNGFRAGEYYEREDRFDRYDRGERGERCGQRRDRDRDRDRDYHHQRFDNHRSNKRRDDWNRNRDRVNGYRVDEKYAGGDSDKTSPMWSPEKKLSPKKVYPENEKLSQREKLVRDIETRRLECLVCVEPIKAHQSVWSCHNCYHILHLQCITKWASSSKSEDGWRCPACQNVVKEIPRDYYCFCGKVKNPQYNRQDIAHSCGEPCGRVEGCLHACTLLCHPGPCPPCQANVKRECGCGRTSKLMQCCLKEPIECDAVCGKQLNCELHTCEAKCHEGKCAACAEKVKQICHCSKQDREVTCTRDSHDKLSYSCGKPCSKDLSCGNHKCKDCCHPGECRPCKLSPEVVTSCPCGKMPVLKSQRTSCMDPVPVCEGTCGKTLRCGKATHPHHCVSKCHLGNCPPCNKQTAVKCRCGHMDQLIKCRQLSTRADDARCKKRCVKKRSCGKHKCNQECCIDIDHICPLPCNYTLSCGKHKCDQPCHRGNCPPCYRSSFEELYCECGAEVIYPPVPCGTKRPACKRPCSRAHPCEHPPQHNCHSAATCPPCMMFTTQWCFGQHEQRKTIPCSQKSFTCGLACNKPLLCGRHKCLRPCHEGICQVAGEVCKQNCTTLRSGCGHKCMAPCHEDECPETPCKEMVEVQCECGNRKQMRACYDLAREYSRIATAQLASSMADMQRGNYLELSEILKPVKISKTNKTLDCNEECRVLERNRNLSIALQSRSQDQPPKTLTKYSDFIRNFAKRDPALVKSIYDALTNLVKLAKESKQKSRSHSFPIMNREKRQLVHELCEMFGVDSVAYDAEPNRNVVATAQKDRTWMPATSIMEVIQREAGQRRVPVPSNNAWGVKR